MTADIGLTAQTASVREGIQVALPSLSRKQRIVAEYILAHPSKTLFATAARVKTVLLADAPFAPDTEVADFTLVFFGRAVGEYASATAGLAVPDCLATGLSACVPDRIKRALAPRLGIAAARELVSL